MFVMETAVRFGRSCVIFLLSCLARTSFVAHLTLTSEGEHCLSDATVKLLGSGKGLFAMTAQFSR